MPVFNSLAGLVGIESNLAPPTDQVMFYTKFQLWAGVLITILAGISSVYWWKKHPKNTLKDVFLTPITISLFVASLLIALTGINNWKYIILVTFSLFSISVSLSVAFAILKQNGKLMGGSIAHIGIALMLIGMMYSSGYSKTVSLNSTGKLYNREFSDEMNKENLLLFRNQPQRMADYTLTYKGPRVEARGIPGYINKETLTATSTPHVFVADKEHKIGQDLHVKVGDTLEVYSENTYYEIEFTDKNKNTFVLYPRIQHNEKMEGILPSPDIDQRFKSDLYTHITSIPDPEEGITWREKEEVKLHLGDTFFVNDYVAILKNVVQTKEIPGVKLSDKDIAIKAEITVFAEDQEVQLTPYYAIRDSLAGIIPDTNIDIATKISLEKILPEEGLFVFSFQTSQKDWIIIKAEEKPFINILWLGTLLMCIGFGFSFYRRLQENKK